MTWSRWARAAYFPVTLISGTVAFLACTALWGVVLLEELVRPNPFEAKTHRVFDAIIGGAIRVGLPWSEDWPQ